MEQNEISKEIADLNIEVIDKYLNSSINIVEDINTYCIHSNSLYRLPYDIHPLIYKLTEILININSYLYILNQKENKE